MSNLSSIALLIGLIASSIFYYRAWKQLAVNHASMLTALNALALRVEALEVDMGEMRDIVQP